MSALIVALLALAVPSPALAQAPVEGESMRRWHFEGALGAVTGVPLALGDRPGVLAEAQASLGRDRAVRLIVTSAYMREVGSGPVRCCGPTPGFRYTGEAFVLGVGPEWRALEAGAGALALDVQYTPIWYHSIRSGSQPDFTPPPTRWHRTLSAVSFGGAWRWRAAKGVSARVGARAYLHSPLYAVVSLGEAPVPRFALVVGVGTW